MCISGQKLFLYPSFENLTTYFTIMEGFQDDFSEEDIKKALMETFNFGENVFASIEKGQNVVMLDSKKKIQLLNWWQK